jgi:hypothetical protein
MISPIVDEIGPRKGALFTVETTEGRRILRVRYTPGDQG